MDVMKQLAILGVLAGLLAASASGRADDQRPAPERDARHVDAIRAAAKGYATWGRVDERPNIAPGLCAAPRPQDYGAPARVRRSEADDAPHGKKLYFLYASEPRRYLDKDAALPVGFSIVKESFAAVPTKDAPAPEVRDTLSTGVPPPVTTVVDDDGTRLKLGARKDLFVMVKVGEDVQGSDGGWIYGTVAPDGTVTSAGRVATCMGCHDEAAAREKLFGLRPPPKP
jgi:hypothetical protein